MSLTFQTIVSNRRRVTHILFHLLTDPRDPFLRPEILKISLFLVPKEGPPISCPVVPGMLSQGCMPPHSDTASWSPDGVSQGPALGELGQEEVTEPGCGNPSSKRKGSLPLGGFPDTCLPVLGKEVFTPGLGSSLVSEWFSSISCSTGWPLTSR